VAADCELTSGDFFPFPISLDFGQLRYTTIKGSINSLSLYWRGNNIGMLKVFDVFEIDRLQVSEQLFGTTNMSHVGVRDFVQRRGPLIGGKVCLFTDFVGSISSRYDTPDCVKKNIQKRSWKTVIGFATRNVPHRGHEYLLRNYQNQADGMLIQPTLAQKKPGQYTETAIRTAFKYLIQSTLGSEKYVLSFLPARSLNAGPREALLQAVIRRNYGCSHFIIGRDHSGFGGFYGQYEAQELAAKYANRLGIKIIAAREPFYCGICNRISSDEMCDHLTTKPSNITRLSSSAIRSAQRCNIDVPDHVFDLDLQSALSHVQLFY
jgi:sulfate adenylyltransferase